MTTCMHTDRVNLCISNMSFLLRSGSPASIQFGRDNLGETFQRSRGVYVGRLGRAAICVIMSLRVTYMYECGLA